MKHIILKFRHYEDASLAYTASNCHAPDTRIGLMDSTMPEVAMVCGGYSSPLGDACL